MIISVHQTWPATLDTEIRGVGLENAGMRAYHRLVLLSPLPNRCIYGKLHIGMSVLIVYLCSFNLFSYCSFLHYIKVS